MTKTTGFLRIIILLVTLGTLMVGCSEKAPLLGDARDAYIVDRTMEPFIEQGSIFVGDPREADRLFAEKLRQGYLSFADISWKRKEYLASRFFGDKATLIAEGQYPELDSLADRDFSEGALNDMARVRNQIVSLMQQGAVMHAPRSSASSQLMFDCWVEFANRGDNDDLVQRCKTDMESSVLEMQTALDNAANGLPTYQSGYRPFDPNNPNNASRPKLGQPVYPKDTMVAKAYNHPQSYVVFFGLNKSKLSKEAKSVLDDIVKLVAEHQPSKIELGGHADRSGSEKYNMKLSKERVLSLAEYLESQGVRNDIMEARAFGETKPRIPTKDGVKEKENRYGEIVLIP